MMLRIPCELHHFFDAVCPVVQRLLVSEDQLAPGVVPETDSVRVPLKFVVLVHVLCGDICVPSVCNMVLGAAYSDPATIHGPNPLADIPGYPEQPQRPAHKPPGSYSNWRCCGILRE